MCARAESDSDCILEGQAESAVKSWTLQQCACMSMLTKHVAETNWYQQQRSRGGACSSSIRFLAQRTVNERPFAIQDLHGTQQHLSPCVHFVMSKAARVRVK